MNLSLRPTLALFATALLCALLAAGCSPGTGGTGTGPITSSGTELQGTPATNSPIGTQTLPASPSSIGGSVTYVSTATGSATVTALLQASSIVIRQGCGIFSYQGQWAVANDGSITVRGQYTIEILSPTVPVPTPQVATAVLRISNAANTATVNVLDAAGDELIAPTVLTRSTAPPAPPNSAGC